MEDKKTIREMAEELGVSKTAIRKKMAVLFSHDTGNQLSETVSGIIYISVSGQKLLIEAFSHNQRKLVSVAVSGKLPETGSQLSETDSRLPETGLQQVSSEVSSVELVIKVLQEQLSVKDSQLSVKDEQLAEKDRQIENLQTALAQEQAALAREQENVKLAQESVRFAQQLHGADKVQQALSSSADVVVDGEAARDETVGTVETDGTVGGAEADGGADGTVKTDGKRHKGFRWPWSRRH